MRSRVASIVLVLVLTGCGATASVELAPVGDSGVRGKAEFHEALTKSFYWRVDVFVTVDSYEQDMRAVLLEGTCASPGKLVATVAVHPPGGGAADVVLNEGKLDDLADHSVHVLDGEPGIGDRIACGEVGK